MSEEKEEKEEKDKKDKKDKEPEASPAEETAPVETAPEQRAGLLFLTARQYAKARAIRWERAAGFLHWSARDNGPSATKTVPQWDIVYASYLSEKVGR